VEDVKEMVSTSKAKIAALIYGVSTDTTKIEGIITKAVEENVSYIFLTDRTDQADLWNDMPNETVWAAQQDAVMNQNCPNPITDPDDLAILAKADQRVKLTTA
jgi:hypothetical protein